MKRSIMMVCAVVCILASCIPAFAIPPNTLQVTGFNATTVASGPTKIVNITFAVSYGTANATPAWAELDSTVTILVKCSEYNSTAGFVKTYTKTFNVTTTPILGKLEWHGAPVLGTTIKTATVNIPMTAQLSGDTVTFAFKILVTATWTRPTGTPTTDVLTAFWKSALY